MAGRGASLGPDAPCLTLDGASLSYGDVVDLSHRVARALRPARARAVLDAGRSGVGVVDGEMVDDVHLRMAQGVLDRAGASGR